MFSSAPGLARQNEQRLADALEKERIVEYGPDPDHKRAKTRAV